MKLETFIVICAVVAFLVFFGTIYALMKTLRDEGGLQCVVAKVWNENAPKPEGCK